MSLPVGSCQAIRDVLSIKLCVSLLTVRILIITYFISTIINLYFTNDTLCFYFSENNGRLIGLIDVIKKDILTWHGDNGQKVICTPIEENTKQWDALCKVREALIGDLADMDETIANIVLNSDDIHHIDYSILLSAIRRVCIAQVCQ